jgi:15-cis-phytoene synthase
MELSADLTPPQQLAVQYAPRAARAGFAWLLAFDRRLSDIAARSSEPLIGQMKLAWWRDVLGADVDARPKGEPLLTALGGLDPTIASRAIGLVNAWELLVAEPAWQGDLLAAFADERGGAVFGGYAALAGEKEHPQELARQWALDDLRQNFGQKAEQAAAANAISPKGRVWRPLTLLALAARGASGPCLVWHGLTGF